MPKNKKVLELTEFEWSYNLRDWKPVCVSQGFGDRDRPVFFRRRNQRPIVSGDEAYTPVCALVLVGDRRLSLKKMPMPEDLPTIIAEVHGFIAEGQNPENWFYAAS